MPAAGAALFALFAINKVEPCNRIVMRPMVRNFPHC